MKYICQTEAVALYLQKYIVYRKRKISFADGSFTSFIELIIKHKDEKFLLALSEPHKPELPETLAKLKLAVTRHPGTHGGFGTWTTCSLPITDCWRSIRLRTSSPLSEVRHRQPARRGGIR